MRAVRLNRPEIPGLALRLCGTRGRSACHDEVRTELLWAGVDEMEDTHDVPEPCPLGHS
jgi:hypothetical protein